MTAAKSMPQSLLNTMPSPASKKTYVDFLTTSRIGPHKRFNLTPRPTSLSALIKPCVIRQSYWTRLFAPKAEMMKQPKKKKWI